MSNTENPNDSQEVSIEAEAAPQAVYPEEAIPQPVERETNTTPVDAISVETEEVQDEAPAPVPIAPSPHITVRRDVVEPQKFKPKTNFVNLLNLSLQQLEDKAGNLDDKAVAGPAKEEWLAAIDAAIATMFYSDKALETTITREGADFRQGVELENNRYITAGAPQIKEKPGALLTGEGALLRIRALSGFGSIVHVPLWHSGIWVKLKAPSDSDLLELNRSLAQGKTEFGRSTLGSIFSNESVYINTILARFALKYVFASSLVDSSEANLVNTIRVTDIPTLVWGLACVVFSKGYPMARPCINNPATCQHIQRELLNISKMCFTDNSALTQWQKEFMLNSEKVHTPDDVAKYQAIMIEKQRGVAVPFNEHTTVHLGVPSIAEYESSGFRWIDSIVQMTETAATIPLEGLAREQYIADQAKLTRLRQYGHWIREISLSSDERIADIGSIEQTLTSLSSSEGWDDGEDDPEALLGKISKFVDNITVSVIGIPRYECIQCGAEQSDEYQKHPELIVIDVVKFFFTLVSQRLQSNISRR